MENIGIQGEEKTQKYGLSVCIFVSGIIILNQTNAENRRSSWTYNLLLPSVRHPRTFPFILRPFSFSWVSQGQGGRKSLYGCFGEEYAPLDQIKRNGTGKLSS